MTYATLSPITRERMAHEVSVEILAAYIPNGCSCRSGPCRWCDEYPRVNRRIRRLLARLEAKHLSQGQRTSDRTTGAK